jgi:thiamine biosynthesis lipoprotein
MKQTRILMGMPITVEVIDDSAAKDAFDAVFDYFQYVDDKFSTYKDRSEISLINKQELTLEQSSADMQTVFALAELTRQETDGYFDIARDGAYDPSGIVKGWAIYNAAELLWHKGLADFYVDAGGDVQSSGANSQGRNWQVGIRNPFDSNEIVKVLSVGTCGVVTSGTYVRGQHIYNPKDLHPLSNNIVSLTVVGPNVYEADRFATAAFAMGREGIVFIERLEGFEGYMIDRDRQATFTTGFEKYTSREGIRRRRAGPDEPAPPVAP